MIGIEAAAGTRRRRVTSGEGMLTPKKSFAWQGEPFEAGSTRVVPDHPVASSEFAHLLKPAYAKESGHKVLRFLERQVEHRTRPVRPPNNYLGEPPDWYLAPTPGREPWRL